MKKAIGILATAIMMLTFTACGQTETSSQTSIYQQSSTSTATNGTSNSTDSAPEPNEQNSSSEPVAESTDNSQESTDSAQQSTNDSFNSTTQNSGDPVSEPTDNTSQSTNSSSESLPEEQEPSAEGKTLIVYFSWSSSGNTEKMANYIKEQTGGDLIELEPVNAYPTDYQECNEVALEERDNNTRPDIANLPDTIDEYDAVFVGYPIWWHTAPMIIGTFLESYDLTGVDIYPFTQSASMDTEQFAQSMEFVRGCANGANVHDGLFVQAADTDGIQAYLTANGFAG